VATTLADTQAEIVKTKAAIEAAEYALAYSQGDRSATRQRITDLQERLARLSRQERELTAYAAGATNPMFVTPKWS
jgi:septal ring factor EnvC (AmiA/AmiB activator)